MQLAILLAMLLSTTPNQPSKLTPDNFKNLKITEPGPASDEQVELWRTRAFQAAGSYAACTAQLSANNEVMQVVADKIQDLTGELIVANAKIAMLQEQLGRRKQQ